MVKISAVINTRNEAKFLEECLKSLAFVDEIVVVDMESDDESRDIAYKFTPNVYTHKPMDWVEPARNFALKKAAGDWILLLDPDETVPKTLAAKLVEIADKGEVDFVRIPRKNIIFGDWVKHSRWWPDHNIRFFKKGAVEWQDAIHSIPVTYGTGLTIDPDEEFSIHHNHYSSIEQYLKRALRYSDVQAKELLSEGYKFSYYDALSKPFAEFLSRFFAGEGYRDGFHGLMLSLLQAFSVLLVYIKVWQEQDFTPSKGNAFNKLWQDFLKEKSRELRFWQYTYLIQQTKSKTQRFIYKLRRRLKI